MESAIGKAVGSRARVVLAAATSALGLLYLVLHAAALRRAGATFEEVGKNILGDPGKHLFHLLLLPTAVLLLSWLMTRVSFQSAVSRRAFVAFLSVFVVLVAFATARDHVNAFDSFTTDLSAHWLGKHPSNVNPNYLSDIRRRDVQRELVRYDRWARRAIDDHGTAVDRLPEKVSEADVLEAPDKYLSGPYVRVFFAPTRAEAPPTVAAGSAAAAPAQLADLRVGYCLLFAGRAKVRDPNLWTTIEAQRTLHSKSIELELLAPASIRPTKLGDSSVCGVLGPFLSLLATTTVVLFFCLLTWLRVTGVSFAPPSDGSDPFRARRHAALAVYVLLSSWLILGAISSSRTRYFIPLKADPHVVAAFMFILMTYLVYTVAGPIELPQWARFAAGGLAVGMLTTDLLINDGRVCGQLARSFTRIDVMFQAVITLALVVTIVLPLLRDPGADRARPVGAL